MGRNAARGVKSAVSVQYIYGKGIIMDNNYNNGQQGEQQNVPEVPQSGGANAQQNGVFAPQSGESNAQQGGQPNDQTPYGQPYVQAPNQFYGQMNNNGSGLQQSDEGIGFSIASLVLGILAFIVSCCLYPLAFILGLVGLILGAVGLKKNAGTGMAVAGIVLSIIAIVIAVLVMTFAFSFVSLFS